MDKIAVRFDGCVDDTYDIVNCIELFDRIYVKRLEENGKVAYGVVGERNNNPIPITKIIAVYDDMDSAERDMMGIGIDVVNDFSYAGLYSYPTWIEEVTGKSFKEYSTDEKKKRVSEMMERLDNIADMFKASKRDYDDDDDDENIGKC